MIVSFHPIYEGDHHRLCAGRDPDADDLAAIKRATAVILPQGCRASLYLAATRYCARVFPNYAARFAYPGKRGQSRLFKQTGVPHPQSFCYPDIAAFFQQHPTGSSPLSPPAVFKLDWGGEGDGVFPIMHDRDMAAVLKRLQDFETTGQKGFGCYFVAKFHNCYKAVTSVTIKFFTAINATGTKSRQSPPSP